MKRVKYYVKYETPELKSETIQTTYHFTKADVLHWTGALLSDGRKIIGIGRLNQQ